MAPTISRSPKETHTLKLVRGAAGVQVRSPCRHPPAHGLSLGVVGCSGHPSSHPFHSGNQPGSPSQANRKRTPKGGYAQPGWEQFQGAFDFHPGGNAQSVRCLAHGSVTARLHTKQRRGKYVRRIRGRMESQV